MNLGQSRFTSHYVFSDPASLDDAKAFIQIMLDRTGYSFGLFVHESLEPSSIFEGTKRAEVGLFPCLAPDSLVVGFSSGGMLAKILQEREVFPCSVLAINTVDSIREISQVKSGPGFVSVYSKAYISGDWSDIAAQSYDIPDLVHGTRSVRHLLAFLTLTYMEQEDISSAVKMIYTQ